MPVRQNAGQQNYSIYIAEFSQPEVAVEHNKDKQNHISIINTGRHLE